MSLTDEVGGEYTDSVGRIVAATGNDDVTSMNINYK